MFCKLTTFAACLSVAAAIPVVPGLAKRQDNGAPLYSSNGTLVNRPNATEYTRPNPTYTTQQLTDLKLALTASERVALLASYGSPDDYFKFDLTPDGSQSNAANGLGGQGYLAHVGNFPVLINAGLSVAIGYLNPCGLDSIHVHNRANELVTLVNGVSLTTGFVLEDGYDQPIINTLGLYQTAIRPQGSLHWEFNNNCEPAVFVAALGHEDPGVSRTAQNFFINPEEVVDANLAYPSWLDNVNTTDYRAQLPAAFAQGAKECYQRCGLTYNNAQAGGYSTAPAPGTNSTGSA